MKISEESKVFGPFTTKQLFVILIAASLGYQAYERLTDTVQYITIGIIIVITIQLLHRLKTGTIDLDNWQNHIARNRGRNVTKESLRKKLLQTEAIVQS